MQKYVKESEQTDKTRKSTAKLEFEIRKKVPISRPIKGQSIVPVMGIPGGGVSPD